MNPEIKTQTDYKRWLFNWMFYQDLKRSYERP